MAYWVYILANKRIGTHYVGMTNDLARRIWEHKEGLGAAFTKKHGANILVHYEAFEDVNEALAQEKRIKKWRRRWKLALIERDNPDWRDLYFDLNA